MPGMNWLRVAAHAQKQLWRRNHGEHPQLLAGCVRTGLHTLLVQERESGKELPLLLGKRNSGAVHSIWSPYDLGHSRLGAALGWQQRAITTGAAAPWGGVLAAAESAASSLAASSSSLPQPSKVGPGIGRARLPGIKQSPKKVNLVASLVRGMRVEDALIQMEVSTKRAAKTVAKLVKAAAANGVQNHGLKSSELFVAEAFVGKDRFIKHNFPHGRGKSGIRERARCNLTVIVKEMDGAMRRVLARASSFSGRKRRATKLTPHRLIEVGRQSKAGGEEAEVPEKS